VGVLGFEIGEAFMVRFFSLWFKTKWFVYLNVFPRKVDEGLMH
jgi:hypothetical protein